MSGLLRVLPPAPSRLAGSLPPSAPGRVSSHLKHILIIAVLVFAILSIAQGQTADKRNAAPQMTLVGRGRVSAIYDIEVIPPYAYALERGILRVLDVSDPAAIRQVGSLEFGRPRVRMALRYPHLFLTGFAQPLGIIDISRPTQPRWIAEFPELGLTANDGIELVGDKAYLIRQGGDIGESNPLFLDVLDVGQNPDRPRRLSSIDLSVRVIGEYGGLVHADGRVFVLIWRAVGATTRTQLIIVDTRTPDRLRIERTLLLPEGKLYRDVDVRSDLLFLLRSGSGRERASGLAVYHMREEGEPEILGEALSPQLSIPIDLMVHGNVVYATFKVGAILATFDISNPRAPKIIHTYTQRDLWSAGLGMTLVNNRLYVTGDNGPSPIFDISQPRAPRLLGRYEFQGGAVSDVVVAGKLAILSSLTDLLFYDISNPRAPRRLGRHKGVPSYEPNEWQSNMVAAASGPRVFVAYETIPAQILDISNPAKPKKLGEFKPLGLVHAIALTPTHAFLGYRAHAEGKAPRVMEPSSLTGRGGIEIVSLHNPRHPHTATALDLDQAVTGLALNGSRLIAVHPDSSLTVVNVRDLSRPTIIGCFAGSGSAGIDPTARTPRVALSPDGALAYVVRNEIKPGEGPSGGGKLLLVDLQDATRPRVAGQLTFDTSVGVELPIVLRGTEAIILAGGAGEVLIVDASDPARPRVKLKQPLPPGVFNTGLALRKNYLYVAAFEDGVLVYRLAPASI